ncbi:inner membrane-spanning protein YciB [Phenylobacterium sp.]|uniref:inner membrane-spanning protein YciB n=1 Tax=Phenylobacterium sp. TaxID=1871053 RepID=UPI00286CE035|nr:inner membrane-spanning protein YciB [Phenylobacterium sp.]
MSPNARKWLRYAVDYAAVVVFALVYFLGGRDFMKATVAIVITSVIALLVGLVVERRIAWLPLFVGAMAALFGGLTLIFHDTRILKVKPTVINLILAGVLFGGLALKRNPLKMLLGEALTLPDAVWRTLTVRFGLLYVVLAIVNIVIWRTQSEATWVLFKTFGLEVMTLVFSLTQLPLLLKHMDASDLPPPPTPE